MYAICRRNVLRNIPTARVRCSTNPRARSTVPMLTNPRARSTVPMLTNPRARSTVPMLMNPRARSTIPMLTNPRARSTVPMLTNPRARSTVPMLTNPRARSTFPMLTNPSARSTVPMLTNPRARSTVPMLTNPRARSTVPMLTNPRARSTFPMLTNPSARSTVPMLTNPRARSTVPMLTNPSARSTVPMLTNPRARSTVPMLTNPRARSTVPIQPCSQIGLRKYSSYRDALMILPARLKKIFNSQADGKNARTRSKENRPSSQEVNGIIREMIQQQTTLDSMLFVTGKLLPKMSLADKAITQQVLTEKMYSEIVANSPVFIETGYNLEICNALLSEGRLDKAVEPLVSSQVFEELIKGMIACTDVMTNWQVLNLFLNLQLLNWNKESKEMFKLFDRIYALDSNEFTAGEMVMFLQGFYMYKPSYKLPMLKLSEWCKNNKVDLENDHWYEVMRFLFRFRYQKGAATEGPKIVFEQITSRLHEGEDGGIADLDLYQLLVLTHSLSDWQFQRLYFPDLPEDTVSVLLMKMTDRVRSMIDDIGDMEIVYLYQIWNNFWFKAVGDLVGNALMNKYFKSPIKEDLKHDVLLSASLIISSALNYPDFREMTRKNVDFTKKTVECLKNSNAYFMRHIGKPLHSHFHKRFPDLIIERLHVFAKDLMVESDEITFLKKYLSLALCSIGRLKQHKRGDPVKAIEIRDRFLEDYLDHYVYNKERMVLGLQMCLCYPKMTAISINFLEKVKYIGDDALIHFSYFKDCFPEKNEKAKIYRRYLCNVNYSQSQSALSKLESDSLQLVCNTYVPPDSKFASKTINLTRLHGVVREPALNVLTTEMLRTLSGGSEDGHSTNMNDSRICLDYWYNKIAEGYSITDPLYFLSLCSDCFFRGYRSGDDVKVQALINSMKPMVKYEDLRRLLYEQDMDWSQYFKDFDDILKKVSMRYYMRNLVKQAFDRQTGHRIFTDDKLYLDVVILLDASDRPVPFSMPKLMQAEKLGLKKVVLMHFAYQSTQAMLVRERLVKDLQKAGYKCAIIWNEELLRLGNRTEKEKISLIRSKVHNGSIVNTAPEITYDPERMMEGPYKKYFAGFKKGKQMLLEN